MRQRIQIERDNAYALGHFQPMRSVDGKVGDLIEPA